MDLGTFEKMVKGYPAGTKFKRGFSEPFSWRGSYDEVAFKIVDEEMTKAAIMKNIKKAYTKVFHGYKGGEYRYGSHTPVNFEEDYGSYTDGSYCGDIISKLEEKPSYNSQEERLADMILRL
jgi:hypothetical protein